MVDLLTKIDDGDSGSMLSDDIRVDDRLDKVQNELPVVDSVALVVTYAGGVVNQEHNVGNTSCNQLHTELYEHAFYYE